MVLGTYMQNLIDLGTVRYLNFYFTIARGCPRLSAAATNLPPLSISIAHLSRIPYAVLFLLFPIENINSITS